MKGVSWPYAYSSPDTESPSLVESWLKNWNPGTDVDYDWNEAIEEAGSNKKSLIEKKKKLAGATDKSTNGKLGAKVQKWQAKYEQSLATCKAYERNARFAVLAQKAWKMERTGKYSVLSKEQVLRMIGALWTISGGRRAHAMSKFAMTTWIESPDDILKLALEYFYPSNVFAKEPGFTRTGPEHVVVNGHGFHVKGYPEMKIPAGTYVYFYTGSGSVLSVSASKKIEGATGDHVLAIPYEVCPPGSSIPNYYLAYPGGLFNSLEINVKGHKGGLDDIVVNRDPWRMVPLSALLQKPRLKQATHIHWCACRETVGSGFAAGRGMTEEKVGGHTHLVVPEEKRVKTKLKPGFALTGSGKVKITPVSE